MNRNLLKYKKAKNSLKGKEGGSHDPHFVFAGTEDMIRDYHDY